MNSQADSPFTAYFSQDIKALDKRFRRNLVNSLSGYKSVCLCGTSDPAGIHNLAIISSVFHVGAHPPLMGMLLRPPVVQRDTYENIARTGFFTLNHLHPGITHQGHQTSARYPEEVSEFEATGLTPLLVEGFPAPFVAESRVRIGLQVKERHHLISNSTVLVIGEVLYVSLPEAAVQEDGLIDLQATETVTVSGLDTYHVGEKLVRLSYAKPDEDLRELKD
ncbi:MAG: flavin reductase [Bacteroidota bacterium]